MNQFNIIKSHAVFTQEQGTNSTQVPIDYKPLPIFFFKSGCFLLSFRSSLYSLDTNLLSDA